MGKKPPKISLKITRPTKLQTLMAAIRRILTPVRIFFSGLLLLGGLVVFWPRISVDPSSMFDSRNPFQSTFQVKNDGFFICYSIESTVNLKKVNLPGITFHGGGISGAPGLEEISRLCPNDRSDISLKNTLSSPPFSIISAELYIDLAYKPTWLTWLPYNFHDSYRFKAERTAQGDYFWRRLFTDK